MSMQFQKYPGRPRAVGGVLKKYLKRRGIDRMLRFRKLYGFWRKAVGDNMAAQTRIVALRRNVLTVEVSSSPLLSELAGYRKHELLDALQSVLAAAGRKQHIDDLNFKLGKFSAE
ncbi:MAG: DciA family protein [Planctomycetota bacterium]